MEDMKMNIKARGSVFQIRVKTTFILLTLLKVYTQILI